MCFLDPLLELLLQRRNPLVDELGTIDDLHVEPATRVCRETMADGADEG